MGRQVSGNGMGVGRVVGGEANGPGKRVYRPHSAVFETEQWVQKLVVPGEWLQCNCGVGEGWEKAVVVDDDSGRSISALHEIQAYAIMLERYIAAATLHKASPPWEAPLEVFTMAMFPDQIARPEMHERLGVGGDRSVD